MSQQSLTLGAIRRSIGRNLGIVIDGVATSTTDTSSLLDTKNLLGADDAHNQKEVMIYETTDTAAPQGESSIVSDFVVATNDATCAPVFTAAITALDKYEMWKYPWRIADINDVINQVINEITGKALQIKETHSVFSESSKYLYDVLSGFTHLGKVEYAYSKGIDHLLADCETAFTAGGSVTASADTAFKKKGTYSAKFVVAAGAASGATLCYLDISSVDLSDAKEVELWVYSSIVLTVGQLQFMLGATAAIASPLETINIPAMAAGTWYRHVITLANPHLDTAIISIGVRQASGVDVGAFTFYLDDVRATDFLTHDYKELPEEYWNIAQGSTPYLMLTSSGLSVVGSVTQMRLTGYRIPARMTADTNVSEIDPAYLVAETTLQLALRHPDIDGWAYLVKYWAGEAARMKTGITTSLIGTARAIQA